MFCNKHYLQHREMTDKQFDRLIEQHALFQQDLNSTQYKTHSHLIQEIDEWQQKMFDEIDKTVKRQQNLTQILNKEKEIKRRFTLITHDLRVKQSTRDYDESDVHEWKRHLAQLEVQLKQLQTSNISKIQLNLNTSNDFTKIIDLVIENTESISAPHSPHELLFRGGVLLNDKQHQLKLNEFSGRENQRWTLIYQGTRDGFAAQDFHRHCDGKGPTVTLLQSKAGGYLFGAYTTVSWSSQRGYRQDSQAFLFTLTNFQSQSSFLTPTATNTQYVITSTTDGHSAAPHVYHAIL
ncbi:unnamed protein product [Didymodactylos carnosus]|uniref:TLDc domain-containing protein n=1 Tax=Didymodactylos carnosus TaxID=1234261 RepID=A0A814EFW9_9BILA|nr:unnamed protein product [Didymodactylos carnosus]CAF0971745.1 unnamed protein product [Didymodactylos carnosus]CAF3690743.1 unnamed protein product [Didymodactylos carnosus]CAF3744765.1 unnamed protein product [Didymodactylos carnosus]